MEPMWCQQKQNARDRGTDNKVILMCCLALLAPHKYVHCQIKRRDFEVWTQIIQSSLTLKILSLKIILAIFIGQNMAKSLSSNFWPCSTPEMSVKCVQSFDELIVQVWLLFDQPNFKYCTLKVSRTELRTDTWTDKRTMQTLDIPGRPLRPGA